MLTTLLISLGIAGVNVLTYQLLTKRMREVHGRLDRMYPHVEQAAKDAESAACDASAACLMLEPAIAQLPKTRSKKSTSKGLGETETPSE